MTWWTDKRRRLALVISIATMTIIGVMWVARDVVLQRDTRSAEHLAVWGIESLLITESVDAWRAAGESAASVYVDRVIGEAADDAVEGAEARRRQFEAQSSLVVRSSRVLTFIPFVLHRATERHGRAFHVAAISDGVRLRISTTDLGLVLLQRSLTISKLKRLYGQPERVYVKTDNGRNDDYPWTSSVYVFRNESIQFVEPSIAGLDGSTGEPIVNRAIVRLSSLNQTRELE